MGRISRRLRYWRNRRQMDVDLAEELEFHLAMMQRDGAPPAAMGNRTLAREDARAVWIWPWLESLWQDVRYGVRSMARQPGFTLVALAGLGAAIGINTSLFTAFNGIALRPWTVRDPGRVMKIQRVLPEGAGDFWSIAGYRFLAEQSRAFSGVIAMRHGEQVKMGGRPLQLTYVSGNYFQVAGVGMERGRGFLAEEDRTGAPEAVAVISHATWERDFGADAEIVGRRISLDEVPFTVVGVTPAGFTGTAQLRNDVWVPLPSRKLLRPNDPSVEGYLSSPDYCCTPVAGRLAPGVDRAQAEAEATLLARRFREQHHLDGRDIAIRLSTTAWISALGKKKATVTTFLMLFLAVTLILMLACANVGNLLLARGAARRREIAVRLAVGGSRRRIVRQLLVESMTLGCGAAVLGLGVAFVLPTAILRRMVTEQTFFLKPDGTVLAYTIGISILACLAFGLAPALHTTRGSIGAGMKDGSLADGRFRLRSVLLATQVAISVMLLAGAGLMTSGLQRAQSHNPGFDVDAVTVFSIDLPASQYTGPRTASFTAQALAEIDAAPGLPACGLSLVPPLANATYSTSFRLPEDAAATQRTIRFSEVSGGYFGVLRIPLLAGRSFTPQDTGWDVAIVNETAARRYWDGRNPIGQSLIWSGKPVEVVGLVKDAYTSDLSAIPPMLYVPMTGKLGTPVLLARDRSAAAVERITAILKQLEPRAEIRSEPLADSFRRQLEPSRKSAEIAGAMGFLALALAGLGMSGVFAFVVRRRTREIGVRMALGASSASVIRLVLASNVSALLFGLAAGLAGGAAASIALGKVLPGVEASDPVAYLGVTLLLACAVLLASVVPARRAARIDPVRALRCD